MTAVIESGAARTVLVIGGLDPTGGAGILADAAAVRSAGFHCAAVASLTTVQDGSSFGGSTVAEPERVVDAIRVVLDGQPCGAVKVGALGSRAIVEALAEIASEPGFPPLVVDPVLRSTTGGTLLEASGVAALRDRLLPLATLVTPNLGEAGALTDRVVGTEPEMLAAAEQLLAGGVGAVLVKGGHLDGPRVADLLAREGTAPVWLRGERLPVGKVRGTGCTLASLIAAELARGRALPRAVESARESHQQAMGRARRVGARLVVPDFDTGDVGNQ
jgi:hydroxymethylpyrimidine/phosphomethylpyrimidine kinase